jgi:hypothetical protein
MKRTIFILLLFFGSVVTGNDYRIHERSNLWETMWDNGKIGGEISSSEANPSMDWPGGPPKIDKLSQRSYLKMGGVWIGGKDIEGNIFFDECGPYATGQEGDPSTWTTHSMGIERFENFNGSTDFDPGDGEEIIISKWTTQNGITVTRKSMAWSYPDERWGLRAGYNNFIIIDYVFRNTGDTDGDGISDEEKDYQDVFFGFCYLIQPSSQDKRLHSWGSAYLDADDVVRYDSTRALLYAYDSTSQASGEALFDYGNLYGGEIRTPGYAGFAKLYADSSTDSSPQPNTVFHAQSIERTYTLLQMGKETFYYILSGDSASLYMSDENYWLAPILLQGYGPYNLQTGDSVHIVIVEAVHGISPQTCLGGSGSQQYLKSGLKFLTRSVDKASELFNNNYYLEDYPPPAPDTVEIEPVPREGELLVPLVLTWDSKYDDYVDPATGKHDLEGYKVYRSDYHYIGPHNELASIPKEDPDFYNPLTGTYMFPDTTVELGKGYFYAVVAFDSSGNESGKTNLYPEPVYAIRPPSTKLDVKVAPNPFKRVSGWTTPGDEYKLMFFNLPQKCTIRIFTVSGNLVRVIEHNNPNSGCEFWDQFTDSRMRVASGIYLYSVESDVGSAKGTILIVR